MASDSLSSTSAVNPLCWNEGVQFCTNWLRVVSTRSPQLAGAGRVASAADPGRYAGACIVSTSELATFA